jgi:hypothetical protein
MILGQFQAGDRAITAHIQEYRCRPPEPILHPFQRFPPRTEGILMIPSGNALNYSSQRIN